MLAKTLEHRHEIPRAQPFFESPLDVAPKPLDVDGAALLHCSGSRPCKTASRGDLMGRSTTLASSQPERSAGNHCGEGRNKPAPPTLATPHPGTDRARLSCSAS